MKKRSWTNNQLRDAVKDSFSFRQTLIKLKLRPAGGNYDQLKKYIKELSIDTAHLKGKGWNRGFKGIGKPLLTLEEILVENSTYQSFKLKKRLYESNLKKAKCEECGWARKTKDGRLPLELDHINGNRHDNRIINLRILCPNCHSLKPTHRGLNKKNKNARVL